MADWINSVFRAIIPEQTVIVREIIAEKMSLNTTFVRVAGLSGCAAVCMSAYGAHVFNEQTEEKRLKHVFESANKMHLIHSVALLGVPLTGRPMLVGSLMTTGMIIFCGTCYFQCLTGNDRPRHYLGRYGAIMMILGWLAMLL